MQKQPTPDTVNYWKQLVRSPPVKPLRETVPSFDGGQDSACAMPARRGCGVAFRPTPEDVDTQFEEA